MPSIAAALKSGEQHLANTGDAVTLPKLSYTFTRSVFGVRLPASCRACMYLLTLSAVGVVFRYKLRFIFFVSYLSLKQLDFDHCSLLQTLFIALHHKVSVCLGQSTDHA